MRALVLIALLLGGCGIEFGCANTIVGRAVSSAGAEAIVFERNCGATTEYSTQISVLAAGAELSGSGNVFVATGGRRSTPWGGPWVDLKWIAADQLLVRYDAAARVFEQKRVIDGVTIEYQAVQ